jgi:ABC-type glycerol-3-phosphate transport system substrate-binding protein
MKKLLIGFFVLIAIMAFAEGQKEPETATIVLLVSGDSPETQTAIVDFKLENPSIEVEMKVVDLSDGSTLTMDAMIAAGTAPNVYTDYMGRVSKYIVPEFALDLKAYLTDLDDFKPGVLQPVTRGNAILALPMPGGAQGMSLNLTMLDGIGEGVPTVQAWDIKKFLGLAEKVPDGAFVTGMFAANQSGDYLYMNWLSSFGATVYSNGYDKTSINSPAGLQTFEFWKMLYDNGYIEKESPILSDDDYAASWAKGKYLATAFFPGWATHYHKTAIDQGMIKEAHKYGFIRFPAAPGVKRVPAATSFPGLVVQKVEDENINKLSARLAWHLNNGKAQEAMIKRSQVYGNRKSVTAVVDDPYWRQIAEIVDRNGTLDLGLTTQTFSAVRTQMFPRLQALWTGKETPAAALQTYETEVNKILGGD